ncbi:short-chain dehydrogenase/reductase family 9C member 7-like isoform X2 [Tubulanus polymorphus]|uniref:short-chain dehydrogenase/reductase family 9C member 7-like isoform X2 n=1 Tax=Tubulanus polymorphus TaxID=672921 RepID=UPI003DA46FFB
MIPRGYRFIVVTIGVTLVWLSWLTNGFADIESILSATVLCTLLTIWVAFLSWRRPPHLSVSGKAVFITGCDSGFGHLTAKRLSSLDCLVFAACLNPCEGGAKELQYTENIHVIKCDVTKESDVTAAKEFIESNLGDKDLWAVVNNAGVAVFSPLEWTPASEFERMMSVNVMGVVRVTKTFLPMLRKSRGRVINVASLAGRFNLPLYCAYAMSKSACIAFSDCLRREMAAFEVMVSTVEPTLYSTNLTAVDRVTQEATTHWNNSPHEIQQAYGQVYFDHFIKRTIRKVLSRSLPNPNEVVDEMMDAVCSERPKSRYVPNLRVRLKVFVLSHLPDRWLDKIFHLGGENIIASSYKH